MRALVGVERRRRVGHLTGRQRRHRPLPRARRPRRTRSAISTSCSTARSSPSTTPGYPSFERLQPRMQAGSAAAIRRAHRRPSGRVHGVRRALARRPLHLRAALHRPACGCSSASGSPGPRGRPRPPPTAGGGARARDRQQLGLEGVVAKRRRQHVPAREAGRRLAQGQAHPWPGARGRRLAPGRGTARRTARLAARRLPRHGGRPRRAALRRPRRLRHRRCPARSRSRRSCGRWRRPTSPFVGDAPPPRRSVGRTRDGGGGRVPRVDECRRPARAALPRRCATTSPRPTSCARPDRSQYRPPVTDDLAVLDATAQAALVRDGAVSPRELVDAALGAHRRSEPAAQRGDPPSRRARPRRGRRARRTVRSAACRSW